MKSHIKISTKMDTWRFSVNPLCLTFRYVNGYFEEINGSSY